MDMQIKNKDHYEVMEQFERLKPGRVDREAKELWSKGIIYCDGQVNEMFLWFRRGVAYGALVGFEPPPAEFKRLTTLPD